MDFNTLLFPCFFAASALLYWLMPKGVRPYLLLAASMLFYCWNPANRSLVALLLGAIVITWACGLALEFLSNLWARRLFLLLSCVSCIGILFWFKYFDFFSAMVSALSGGHIGAAALELAAPLGLSYFTFEALGYAIDCYTGKCRAVRSLPRYALFVSFFPAIFTGPIERAGHLLPQLKRGARFDYDTVAGGAFRMLWGYFKKMVLADGLAAFVRAYYLGAMAQTGPAQAAAAVLFSLQLYFDFSGCCDIAIGGARLFGIRLLENFDNPFLSTSYSELWRRWHMSLTGWFRDYLYYPLGGSRCSVWRWALNLLLIFVLSGLWHGAAAGYLLWGLLCGILALAERLPHRLRTAAAGGTKRTVATERHAAGGSKHAVAAEKNAAGSGRQAAYAPAPAKPAAPKNLMVRWLRRLFVFLEFSLCFILFAASLYGAKDLHPFRLLLSGWNAESFALLRTALSAASLTGMRALVLALGSTLVFAIEARGDVALWIRRRFFVWRWALYLGLCYTLLFFAVFGQSAFIYQQY